MYDRTRIWAQQRMNTPVLTHAQKPPKKQQKKFKKHTKAPVLKARERQTLCSGAIFILRPHALSQFFRGDKVQSLQTDWSIFITALGTKTNSPPPSFPLHKAAFKLVFHSLHGTFRKIKHTKKKPSTSSFIRLFLNTSLGQNSQSHHSLF